MNSFKISTLTPWSNVGIPANASISGPPDTIDSFPLRVKWVANQSVTIAIVQGSNTVTVGSGLTGEKIVSGLTTGAANWLVTAGASDVQNVVVSAFTDIGNTSEVDSVFGRTGSVVAQSGDYTASQVDAIESPSTAPSDGQVLFWNGTAWEPETLPAGGATEKAIQQAISAANTFQNVVQYTPSANGLFMVQAYALIPAGGATLGAQVTFTDSGGSETLQILATTSLPAGPWSPVPVLVPCLDADAITLQMLSSSTATLVSGLIWEA